MRRASLWLIAVLAGCSLTAEEKIDQAGSDELVLQREDVDPALRQTWVRNLGGRPISEVRYRHGALTIRSHASVMPSRDAADDSLDAARDLLRRRPSWQPIDEPGLGDESFAATLLQGGARHYDVHWREANATASLSVTAVEEALPLSDVLELARKQQHRLEAAAG